jgi:hypothetical protein
MAGESADPSGSGVKLEKLKTPLQFRLVLENWWKSKSNAQHLFSCDFLLESEE